MKILILLSVVSSVCTRAADDCSSGPTYWCSSLKTAKLCGALQHCIDDVWSQKTSDSLSGKDVIRVMESMKAVQNHTSSRLCSYCTQLVSNMKNLITGKDTEEGLVQNDRSPSPIYVQVLVGQLDPVTCCRSLGFCDAISTAKVEPKKTAMLRETTPSVTRQLAGKQNNFETCALCKTTISMVTDMLKKHSTEVEIIKALEQVCRIAPSSWRKQCDTFIEKYGSELIELLLKDANPEFICVKIGLCDQLHEKEQDLPEPTAKVSDMSALCDLCKTIVKHAEHQLQRNATKAEIRNALSNVCNKVTPFIKGECKKLVRKYTDKLVDLIVKVWDPKRVCQMLTLCHKSEMLLGANKCSYGPNYWCASRDTAMECNAMEYCEHKVWA